MCRIRNKIPVILVSLCILLNLVVLAVLPGYDEGEIHRTFAADWQHAGNPLMGYAPRATSQEVSEDISLVYVDITWREWEPEKGEYAVDDVIEEHQLDRWRAEGKHVVLRFVCDVPDETSKRDIPDWLYLETNADGKWYDTSSGKGYAPDYNNPLMIEYHAKAVHALGEAFGQDTFVSYVELGSLGHWGEWHVKHTDGIQPLPLEEVREQYVAPWIDAFPNARILMRRPFTHAAKHSFGVYNDMGGNADSTEKWLGWIEKGGAFSQTGEENGLSAMPDFWKTAPSGGEITSSISKRELLTTDLEQTISLTRRSHTTFWGPGIADITYESGYMELLRNMGYRLWISEASLKKNGSTAELSMVWENNGVAPFYWDWPVYAYVITEQGDIVESRPVNLALSKLLPGEKLTCSILLTTEGLLTRDHAYYAIGVGITDPMTGKRSLHLDMKARQQNGMTILFD